MLVDEEHVDVAWDVGVDWPEPVFSDARDGITSDTYTLEALIEGLKALDGMECESRVAADLLPLAMPVMPYLTCVALTKRSYCPRHEPVKLVGFYLPPSPSSARLEISGPGRDARLGHGGRV